MTSETLSEKLNYTRAYRQTRLDVAQWVLDRPETFSELLEFCFQTEEEISYRATWVLEFVCLEKMEMLLPHLDSFFDRLPNVHKDQAVRPLSKICEKLMFGYYKIKNKKIIDAVRAKHKETIVECCFDWMITDQKVACKVYSMLTLYFIGTEMDWIHPELQIIIEKDIHSGSPAYKARGKYTLAQIAKFKRQN